jgi:outer membrane receptor protein involved in Fe transport
VNWHTRFFNAWAAYDYDRPETWSLRTQFYYRDSTVLGDTVPVIELPQGDDPGRQYRYYRPNHLAGNETRLEWGPSPAWRFTFGLVLERERLADGYSITSSGSAGEEAPPPPRPPMTTNSLASAYAQARVALHPSLDLFAGIRHDDSSYYGTVDTPRLGLVLNRGRLTAKALAAEAFRAPRPWDYTDGTGNPELRPEEMRSYEVSGAWAFSGRWRLEAAAYRNRLDNLLVRVDGGAGWRWENGGGLDTDGVEAALEYRRGPWRGFVNATWTDSTGPADAPTPEIAEWGANGGVQVRFSTAFLLLVRAHYYGSRENPKPIPATGDARIDDAFVLGLAATLVLPGGFGLQLVVDNALDAEYYHPSNLDPSRYRQAQRTVRLVGGIAF